MKPFSMKISHFFLLNIQKKIECWTRFIQLIFPHYNTEFATKSISQNESINVLVEVRSLNTAFKCYAIRMFVPLQLYEI